MSNRKSIGIVRNVDNVGRIVLPKELRESFLITDHKTQIEMWLNNDEIILSPIPDKCCVCHSEKDLYQIDEADKSTLVCEQCIRKIKGIQI